MIRFILIIFLMVKDNLIIDKFKVILLTIKD